MSLNLFEAEEEIYLEFAATYEEIVFRIQLFILCATGKTKQVTEEKYRFRDCLVKKLHFPFHLTKKEVFDKKDNYLKDDVLNFRCECAFAKGMASNEIESTVYGYNIPLVENEDLYQDGKKLKLWNDLKENLKSFRTNQLFSDTNCGQKRIRPPPTNVFSALDLPCSRSCLQAT
ncbi:hypothetical protein NPIL_66621 [Nephila pilipes]|uniref:Uncharacterized protein n=1 Tax=Nephila pilipes TaxID=299642 RepID=A0A8X6UCF9_NEPPI|nr:hypothetical protein NPIL_66621 [Nephila pilipes]